MQRTSKDPVIQLKNLVKIYNENKVLNKISLNIFKGETLALIGTSGSGKTTLLKSINGLIPRSSGDILVYGKHIDDWELTALRRRMGYVIQDVGLFPHYTIEKNIRLVPELLGWEDEHISDRIDQLLEKIHIPYGMKNRYPGELSGGQQQRVGLARALAADPDIILMDEPFGALDPIIRSGMQQEFLNMEGLKDKAIILVTHDMSEAAVLADRICLLDHGTVQQTGTLKELLFNPDNNFVKSFLDGQRDELELRAIHIKDLESLLPADLLRDVSNCTLAEVPSKYSAEVRKTYYLRRNEILSKLNID